MLLHTQKIDEIIFAATSEKCKRLQRKLHTSGYFSEPIASMAPPIYFPYLVLPTLTPIHSDPAQNRLHFSFAQTAVLVFYLPASSLLEFTSISKKIFANFRLKFTFSRKFVWDLCVWFLAQFLTRTQIKR